MDLRCYKFTSDIGVSGKLVDGHFKMVSMYCYLMALEEFMLTLLGNTQLQCHDNYYYGFCRSSALLRYISERGDYKFHESAPNKGGTKIKLS